MQGTVVGLSLVFICLSWSVVKKCAIAASRSFRSCHGLGVSSSLGSTHEQRVLFPSLDGRLQLDTKFSLDLKISLGAEGRGRAAEGVAPRKGAEATTT